MYLLYSFLFFFWVASIFRCGHAGSEYPSGTIHISSYINSKILDWCKPELAIYKWLHLQFCCEKYQSQRDFIKKTCSNKFSHFLSDIGRCSALENAYSNFQSYLSIAHCRWCFWQRLLARESLLDLIAPTNKSALRTGNHRYWKDTSSSFYSGSKQEDCSLNWSNSALLNHLQRWESCWRDITGGSGIFFWSHSELAANGELSLIALL